MKSYLADNAEGVDVKAIDLNIDFVDRIVQGKIATICHTCIMKNDCGARSFQRGVPREQRKLFELAKSVIKDSEKFYDKDLFVQYVGPLYSFVSQYFYCFSWNLRHYLEGRITDEGFIFHLIKDEIAASVKGNPELIGFSVLCDSQISFVLTIARFVKKKYGIPIVLGGPALFNLDVREVMESFDFIDFIVLKEGEVALLELIKNLGQAENYETVPNLVWRSPRGIVCNEEKVIEDLNELPTPDFSDFRLDKYYFGEIILPISSSRSCPWNKCKFCQLSIQHGRYRQRSIEKVIEDIDTLVKKYNVRHFFLADLEVAPLRLKQLGEAVLKANLEVYFACYARPTKSLNYEVLKTAYQGGCRFLLLGVESLSGRFLELVNKGTTAESVLGVLKNTSELKIGVIPFMLCGIPTQTKKEMLADMKKILNLQKKYNIFSVIYTLFNLGKHTAVFKERENYKIEIIGRRKVFSATNGKSVYTDEWLEYKYKDGNAYDLLVSPKHYEDNSLYINDSIAALTESIKEAGINKNDWPFLLIVTNFLFEIQLLYLKRL
ncbi:B12-binding domain-containing radical SAM protein [Chloroflexota bacterium]